MAIEGGAEHLERSFVGNCSSRNVRKILSLFSGYGMLL